MNRLLPFLALLALVCGCERPPVPVSASGDVPAADARLNLPNLPPPPSADGVQVPMSATAVPLGGADEPSFVISVTAKGLFLLAPGHGVRDAKGKPLDRPTAGQLPEILTRRAELDRDRAVPPEGVGADGVELPTRIAFRVDAGAPFERVAPAWRSASAAGFTKGEWRVNTADGADGRIPFVLAPPAGGAVALPDADAVRFEVFGTAAGALQKVVKAGAGEGSGGLGVGVDVDATIPDAGKPLDTKPEPKEPTEAGGGADPIEAFGGQLREHAVRKPDRRATVVLEIDGRVHHAEVIRLTDAARQNGFTNVMYQRRAAKQP